MWPSWYGLYCESMDCELREVTVRITSSSAKNVLDQDEPLDVIDVDGKPMALFHGMTFEPGKVTTWYKSPDSPFTSRQYTSLQKLGRWTMPWSSTPLSISWVKLPDHGGFRYFVSDGSTKQFLFRTASEGHYGGDTTPIVEWVGDVDRDGKLDMLLELPDDNCGFDERLYLSSQADDGELLHKAAQLSGHEVACGC